MKNILIIAFLFIILLLKFDIAGASDDVKYSSVRVYFDSRSGIADLQKSGLNIEDALIQNDSYIVLIVSSYDIMLLKESDIKYEVIIDNLEEHYSSEAKKNTNKLLNDDANILGSVGGFFTLPEIADNFDNIIATYPKYFQDSLIIGRSHENRAIMAYCFGNKNKPEVLLTALLHAREPLGTNVIIYYLRQLMELAETGNFEAQYILNERAIWVIPAVNPDGWYFNYDRYPEGGGLWRKNRRVINDSTFGIDLNRNFGPYDMWNAPNNGSSVMPRSETYRGTHPFSEPELKAVRNFVTEHDFRIALNYHSFGNYLIYPYHALETETPDSLLFRALAREISRKNLFSFGTSLQTVRYGARGTSDDWLYISDSTKNSTLAITPELGKYTDRFYATPERIIEISKECFDMNFQICWSADLNIRPYEMYFDYIDEEESHLALRVRDIGLNAGIVELYIRSLDTLFSIDTEILDLNADGTWREKELFFDISINKPHDLIANGTYFPFEVNIIHDGISRRDTFDVKMMCYEETALFDFIDQPDPKKLWYMGDWGLEYYDELNRLVLSDSPQAYYIDSSFNILELREPLQVSNPTVLEFTSQWNIEPNDDFAVVQISTNAGESWDAIRTSRMVQGSGRESGRQDTTLYGFHGNFTGWVTQKYDFSDHLGETINLRFVLISDQSAQYDGWYISNINIKEYDDCPLLSSISQTNEQNDLLRYFIRDEESFDLYIPDPLKNNSAIVNIYNIYGKPVYSTITERREVLRVSLANWASGHYFIRITAGKRKYFRQLLLIR